MKRLLAVGLALGMLAGARAPAADSKEKAEAKEALKALQEFIGAWKGSGGPDKPKPSPRDPIWSETLTWGWRFKGDDAWLLLDVKNGKHLKGGELRYLPGKKVYQFTALTKDDQKLVFEGELKNDALTLERTDPDSKATEQLKMNTAGDGVRFIYRVASKAKGGTVWRKDYLVACTKEGESLGKTEKKNECVVSGGVGTMAISYKGETYYVCCSGCADEFRANPEKYVAEFKAKKAKK
jgi:YHS domain